MLRLNPWDLNLSIEGGKEVGKGSLCRTLAGYLRLLRGLQKSWESQEAGAAVSSFFPSALSDPGVANQVALLFLLPEIPGRIHPRCLPCLHPCRVTTFTPAEWPPFQLPLQVIALHSADESCIILCRRQMGDFTFFYPDMHVHTLYGERDTSAKSILTIFSWSVRPMQPQSPLDFPGSSDGKGICLQCGRPGFDIWVGKIPWRRKWQPTPVFLSGESHGQMSLAGYSPWGCKLPDTMEWLTLSLPFKESENSLWQHLFRDSSARHTHHRDLTPSFQSSPKVG